MATINRPKYEIRASKFGQGYEVLIRGKVDSVYYGNFAKADAEERVQFLIEDDTWNQANRD